MKKYIYVKKRYILLVGAVDFIGNIIFGMSHLVKRARQNCKIERIAVVELAHIGDVLATTPALRLLKEKFPKAVITAVVSPWGKEVLTGNPGISDIVIYRASWFDRINKIPFSLSETLKFIRTMRNRHFDLGIDMRGDFRTILLMWLCGIKKRVGYGFAGGSFFLTDTVPFDAEKRQDKHQIDHNLNLIDSLKEGERANRENKALKIFYSDNDVAHIDSFLKEREIAKNDFLIAIHPGSGLPAKCWPIERFASLIEKMLEKRDVKIVLVGGPGENDLSHKLGYSNLPRVVDAVGKTNIKQLAALLKRCDLFVGGDSAVMHIASAVATPIVAIWGGHNKPSHWRPLGQTDIIIHKKVNCSPCGLKQCKDLKCLRLITVDDVLGGIVERMKRLVKI